MAHFVGLDVSLKETSVCVVDEVGQVLCERKVPTEPDEIAVLLTSVGGDYVRVGIEAGPLSQWLVNGLAEASLPMVCVETRHMKALRKAQQVNKSDRNDARGIAQMMRVGLFKPVHVKTLAAQEQRMLLTSRRLVQRKLLDIECDMHAAQFRLADRRHQHDRLRGTYPRSRRRSAGACRDHRTSAHCATRDATAACCLA